MEISLTNKILLAILESQLKIEEIKLKHYSITSLEYEIIFNVINEIKTQINQIKNDNF